MKALEVRDRLFRFTVAAVFCTALLPAVRAQQPDQAGTAEADALEEIVVTGSRIRRAGFDTLQPATVVDGDFIDAAGLDNAAEALNQLPQFGIPGSSNKGGQDSRNVGQNIVNLFGLGSQRTLTLINGRRTVGQNTPSFSGGGAAPGLQVDLNIIPTALIERIETIETGGAPIYGSDAIAGTVNVILKDDYEGMQMDFQGGANENGDGESWRYRALLGTNFADDRGNVVMDIEWNKQTALDAADRPDLVNSPAFVPNPKDTGPSDGIVDAIFTPDALSVFQVPNSGYLLLQNDAVSGLQDANGNPTFESFLKPGTPVLPSNAAGELVMLGFDGNVIPVAEANLGTPFPTAVSFFSHGADGVNNPFVTDLDETNTFVSPLNRFNLNSLGHYDLTENVEVFFEGLYARSAAVDRSNQPPWSTLFFDNADNGALGNYRINMVDNPFVSQEIRDLMALNGIFDPTLVDDPSTPDVDESDQYFWVSRSNIDIIGDAPNFLDQDVFRFVGGADGDFSALERDWTWELSYVFGQTNSSTYQTVVNGRRLSFATDVVTGADGNPVCRVTAEGATEREDEGGLPGSGTNFDFINCVPINVLDYGSLSDEARSYVVQRRAQSTQLQQTVVQGNITGTLFEIPGGPLDFAVGVTNRREQASFDVGQGTLMGVPPNPPVIPVSGGFETWEVYGEVLVPIISGGEGLGFVDDFIQNLSFEGAIRTVDNNFAGRDNTWTAGGRVTPAFLDGMLTFRGNHTEAIRSPAVTELFLPQIQIGTFANDPCDQRDIESGNNPAVRRANCEAAVAALAGTLEPGFSLDTFRAISRNASQAAVTGGNLELANERSSANSMGIILRPEQWVPGLELSIDYTEIDIADAIVNLSATNILSACFDSANFPNEPTCDRFERDPVTFQPQNFVTGFVNAAELRFRGWSLQGNYGFELADISDALNGSLRFYVNYFKTLRNDQRVGEGDLNIIAGTRGTEEDKYQVNVTYHLERFSGMLQWRGDLGGFFSPDDLAAGNFESRDIQEFPSFNVFNLGLRYDLFEDSYIQLHVSNLFDAENKPLRMAATDSNSNLLDDVFGRRYLLTIGTKF